MRGAYWATIASLQAKLPEASTTPRRADGERLSVLAGEESGDAAVGLHHE